MVFDHDKAAFLARHFHRVQAKEAGEKGVHVGCDVAFVALKEMHECGGFGLRDALQDEPAVICAEKEAA